MRIASYKDAFDSSRAGGLEWAELMVKRSVKVLSPYGEDKR